MSSRPGTGSLFGIGIFAVVDAGMPTKLIIRFGHVGAILDKPGFSTDGSPNINGTTNDQMNCPENPRSNKEFPIFMAPTGHYIIARGSTPGKSEPKNDAPTGQNIKSRGTTPGRMNQ